MHASHSIETPTNAVGAVSIIRVMSEDLDEVCETIGTGSMRIGQITLAPILGLDDALLARFDRSSLLIMPHGGIAITRMISRALSERGVMLAQPSDPMSRFPEAADIHEARMLAALTIAQSPMAVDVLLDQPRRWRQATDSTVLADSVVLHRLLTPPVLVAVGRANIGKSSLVNALAGEPIAMVSDHAGTTRDHVGVLLNLGGLAVRWVDSPGIDERVVVGEELALLKPVLGSAELIIHAIDLSDGSEPGGRLDPALAAMMDPDTPVLRVGLRSDLGDRSEGIDCSCSSQTGDGIQALTSMIVETLIPPCTLTDPRPWRFWDS